MARLLKRYYSLTRFSSSCPDINEPVLLNMKSRKITDDIVYKAFKEDFLGDLKRQSLPSQLEDNVLELQQDTNNNSRFDSDSSTRAEENDNRNQLKTRNDETVCSTDNVQEALHTDAGTIRDHQFVLEETAAANNSFVDFSGTLGEDTMTGRFSEENSADNGIKLLRGDILEDLRPSEDDTEYLLDSPDSPYINASWMTDEFDQLEIITDESFLHEIPSRRHSHSPQLPGRTTLFQTLPKSRSLSSLTGEESEEDALSASPIRQATTSDRGADTAGSDRGADTCSGDSLEDSLDTHSGRETLGVELLPQHASFYETYSSSASPIRTLNTFGVTEDTLLSHHMSLRGRKVAEDLGDGDESVTDHSPSHPSLTRSISIPSIYQTRESAENNVQPQWSGTSDRTRLQSNDADDNLGKKSRQEDVTRKPSVLDKFRSPIRAKKKKKETKDTDCHQFVTITVSDMSPCDVCQKTLTNKTGLTCENCHLNVHENGCRDQRPQCSRKRHQTSPRDVATQGGQRSPEVTDESKPPTDHSQVMKHNRPQSMLSRIQPEQRTYRTNISIQGKPSTEDFQLDPTMITGFQDAAQPSTIMDMNSDSLESLDGVVPSVTSWLEDEPDLQLADDEIYTVDEENKRKFNSKDVKRQNNIWELINTEKQYVKRLKIMQKIFARLMLRDLNYTEGQVNKLFPRLDELVELHAKFLRQLLNRQAKNDDRSVDEIGDVLLDQFQGSMGDKMKSVYGVFCSRHTEAMQLYKDLVRNERKFQNFAKYCNNLSVCEKREISDFILGVTVRLAKYPILIDAILNNTKDKKDRAVLSQALLACKDVVQHVDRKVAAYEKLVDIQNKMDSKTVTFKGKKFKRQDFNADNRDLVHAGRIGWKNARGRVYDVLAVVLTDVIVFLQKNEQKYTFFIQDNKSCVISLHNLVVREKGDVRGSLGIYIISQRLPPEMYELVCQSKAERKEWIKILQQAIKECPSESDVRTNTKPRMSLSSDIERRRMIERANKVKNIIYQLHQKDEIISECCDDKNKLMLELLNLSSPTSAPGSRPNSQEIDSIGESVEIINAALQEASRLTDILQGTETHLTRSYSSVGEQSITIYSNTDIPRRSETFSGYDSSHVSPKATRIAQRMASMRQAGEKQLLEETNQQQDRNRSYSDTPDIILDSESENNAWKNQVSTGVLSDQGSLEELSSSSVSSLNPAPASHEQMTSLYHLTKYLHSLMNLTSKQCTKVESLQAELAETKEEMSKLSADVHGHPTMYVQDKVEELQTLQDNIRQEKQQWDRLKTLDQSRLDRERERLENDRKEIEKEKLKLRTQRENIKKERELLQHHFNLMREQGYKFPTSVDEIFVKGDLEHVNTTSSRLQQKPIIHTRLGSSEWYDTIEVSDAQDIRNDSPYSWETSSWSRDKPRLSFESVQDQHSGSASSPELIDFPSDLMDTYNEQRISDMSGQNSAMKNAEATTNYFNPFQKRRFSAKASSPVSIVDVQNPSASSLSRAKSMSAASPLQLKQQKHAYSVPSGMSKMVSLAEMKETSSFSTPNSTRSSPLSNKALDILHDEDDLEDPMSNIKIAYI